MKFENRNSKSEANSKLEYTLNVALMKFRTSNFGLVSNFEFRASSFLFPALTLAHD